MDENKPKTISINENGDAPVVQTVVKPSETTTEKPLIPTPESLPEEAEPAMESAPAEATPAQDEAGNSALVDQVKPEVPAKKEEGVDDIIEQIRADVGPSTADQEIKELDLETNQIIVGPVATRVEDMMKHYGTVNALKAARKDPKSLVSRAASAVEHGWGTTSAGDMTEVLKHNEAYAKLNPQSNVEKFPGIKDGHPSRITHKSVDVTGKEAILAIKARLGGLVRVNLLNSGFWVALRSPQLNELQEIFATIDFEQKEIGRIMGGHFALITDMYLKRKFIDVLIQKRLIVESNFKDIFKAGAFVRNLAFHDYDTLVHAMVMLMTRGGLRYRCICPKCGNMSIETLDVSACKFINEDLWTPEVREWWNKVTDAEGKMIKHDEKSLTHYRENILGRSHVFTQVFDNGLGDKVKIDLLFKEPTYQRFFEVGDKLIHNLNETIDNIANGDADRADLVKNSLSLHAFQMVAPWIEKLTLWKNDTTVELTTTDTTAILEHLDQTVQTDTSIFTALQDFIEESRFNYIGTYSIKCPSCGAVPDSEMKGFYPLEIQTIFFGLSFRLSVAGR